VSAAPPPAAAPAGDAPLDEAPVLELRDVRKTYPAGVGRLELVQTSVGVVRIL
jgi:hypothetical protein